MRADDFRRVGNLQHVGHVGGGGGVEDGDFLRVGDDVQHRGHEVAAVQHVRRAGFERDCACKILFQFFERGDEAWDIVILMRVEMPAAEIEVFDFLQREGEFGSHMVDEFFRILREVFAEIVNVQQVDLRQDLVCEFLLLYSETRARGGGVVQGAVLDQREPRIDAQADDGVFPRGANQRREFLKLMDRVEINMGGIFQDFLQVFFGVGGAVGMDLFPLLLAAEMRCAEAGLIEAAGRRAVEDFSHNGKDSGHREALGGEQELDPRFLFDALCLFHVRTNRGDIGDIGGGLYVF